MALNTVIPLDDRVPGFYFRALFAQGPRSAGANARALVLFGNKRSGASMLTDIEYPCASESDAETIAGTGSELALMARAAFLAYPGATVKLMAMTESAGASASGTITFTASTPSAGTVGVSCIGEEILVPVATTDTATTIATAVAAAINQKPKWPVTATSALGVVTITCKNTGPRGNHIQFRARVVEGTGTTAAVSGSGFLTGGTTSDNPQNCLDAQLPVYRTYLVCPYQDSTNINLFRAHVDAAEEPEADNRKLVVAASVDTPGNAQTVATAVNFPRVQLAHMEKSDWTPAMLASAVAAHRARYESLDPAHNFDMSVVPGIPPHYSPSDFPTRTELKSMLNNGVTPLSTAGAGQVVVVTSCTTKSQDANGRPDPRVYDTHKVVVTDYACAVLQQAFADEFGGFKLSADPAEDELPPSKVFVPRMGEDLIGEILTAMEGDGGGRFGVFGGLLDIGSVERNRERMQVALNSMAVGRFDAFVPLDPVELLHQGGFEVAQEG